ncbi:MAG: M20/M25/M40 family metallo-hydrolase [Pyrinomonadaceae bacterium]
MKQNKVSDGSSVVGKAVALATFVGVALLIVLAVYLVRAPAPSPAGSPATDFSSERALKHVERIARVPHPIGSAAQTSVRDYVVEELNRMGVAAEVQRTTVTGPTRNGYLSAATVSNVVGLLEGTDNSKALMLVAHYDSAPAGPGASDDGAGVAAVLEVVRALKAGQPLRNRIVVLLSDGEEAGLFGARGFVDEHPLMKEVGLVLNFEARGTHGPSMLFETSNQNGWLIKEFARAAPHPVASSLFYELYKLLPNDTDLSVFKKAGLPALNFAFIEGSSRYHTSLDNIENLDERSLQHHGSYGLALSRHFGGLDMRHPRERDAVYFDILGSVLIRYSTAWVIPLVLLVALSYAGLLALGLKRRQLTFKGLGAGFLLTLLSVAGAGLLVTAVWRLVRAAHPGYELFIVGDPYNSQFYVMSFVALAVAVSVSFFIWFRKKFSAVNLTLGGLLWWVILMVLTGLYLPGGSYLFTWPLLFTLVAVGVNLMLSSRPDVNVKQHLALYLLCALPGIILGVPIVKMAFTGLTLNSSALVLPLVVLLLGLLLPLVEVMSSLKRWWLPGALGGLGLILLVAGSLTAGFDRAHPKPSSLFYGLDSDTGMGVWASLDEKPDEWTSQFFAPSAKRAVLDKYFAFSSRKYLQTEAAAVAPMEPPVVELLGESTSGEQRTLHLRISSPRQAPVLMLHLENEGVVEAVINGKRVDSSHLAAAGESRNRWGLRYYGVPADGLDLIVTVKSSAPLKFRCVDQSYGLPQLTNAPFKPRPDDMMASPAPTSDTVMVSKSYTF